MAPLSTTPYDDVKNTLMTLLVEPEERRIQQLLGAEQLDALRPTQFFHHQQKLLWDKAASLDTDNLREFFSA